MKILKSWWPVFIVGALASSGGLLDFFWERIPIEAAFGIGGIGLVCIIRGILRLVFAREQDR